MRPGAQFSLANGSCENAASTRLPTYENLDETNSLRGHLFNVNPLSDEKITGSEKRSKFQLEYFVVFHRHTTKKMVS